MNFKYCLTCLFAMDIQRNSSVIVEKTMEDGKMYADFSKFLFSAYVLQSLYNLLEQINRRIVMLVLRMIMIILH